MRKKEMKKRKNHKIESGSMSRTSPKGGKRGCLCKDNKTYSKNCCDGSMHAQGIGAG